MKPFCILLFIVLLACGLHSTAAAAERVRISVLGLFHPRELVVEALPSSPLIVSSGREQLKLGTVTADRITVTLSRSRLLVRADGSRIENSKVVVEARNGGDAEFILTVPGKLRRRYNGKLLLVASDHEISPVVEMNLETAVASVVAAELPTDAPAEAMKAQAIVSRSYLISAAHRHTIADLCDTTHCQFLREPPSPHSPASIAARETKGLVLAFKGKPISAMFSASCGGRTHSLADVGYAGDGYPYYSVECRYCQRSPHRWTSHISEPESAELKKGNEKQRIKTGRKLGWNSIQSNTYSQTGSGAGITLSGIGRGHGVGLCQRGALGMARSGKGHRSILAHYFPNTIVQPAPVRDLQ